MWCIVRADPEDEEYPMPDVLMNDDGSVKTFIDEVTAWRYMELICKELDFPTDAFMNDASIGLMRIH